MAYLIGHKQRAIVCMCNTRVHWQLASAQTVLILEMLKLSPKITFLKEQFFCERK
jgi:hypothetical protein